MDEKMKKYIPLFVILGLAFVGFGVYVIVNKLGMATVEAQAAGFWLGLWQGCIVILSFIVSWFDKDITIYQTGNVGFWYNLGYIFGLTVALGGGAKASNKRK
jgi:hypothetical protein